MNAVTPVDPSEARLPVTYEAARTAIAECERLDECKTWQHKAAAMAAYAKMQNDHSLREMAVKIADRAARRFGELAKLFPRGDEATRYGVAQPRQPVVTRSQAAQEAGASAYQLKTALRVAAIPDAEFERQVESEHPPVCVSFAMQGTESSGPPSPWAAIEGEDVREACETLARFARFCERAPPEGISKAVNENEALALMDLIYVAAPWLEKLMIGLGANDF